MTRMLVVGLWLSTVGKPEELLELVFLSSHKLTKRSQKARVIPNVRCRFISSCASTRVPLAAPGITEARVKEFAVAQET